jgi:polynucleotide 5'-kinase involved in rRNA processing
MKIEFEEAYARLSEHGGTVVLLGSMGTGKTQFAFELLRRSVAAGGSAALIDADIDISTVGPPTTVGSKTISSGEEVTEDSVRAADELGFVGALNPRQHLLPLVMSVARVVQRAREGGARLIVVDTTGFVAGVYGQWLNYHVMDAAHPDYMVAFERGGEMEPLIGIAQRFTSAEVLELDATAHIQTLSVEDRMTAREKRFESYFGESASRWRVKPTVFMPTVPPEFDLGLLDGLVVGMEDGSGRCVGIGLLEYDAAEGILRMVSPVTEGVRGLRLGSVKISRDGRSRGTVSLPELFGSE